MIYLAAQLSGSFFGYVVLRVSIPTEYLSNPSEFCMTQPNLATSSAFAVEFVISFIFTMFLCAMFDPRNAKNQGEFLISKDLSKINFFKFSDSASIKFGLLVAGFVLVAVSFNHFFKNDKTIFH